MNVYNVVKEAQANAENYINPNVRACDVDSAARTVIEIGELILNRKILNNNFQVQEK